MLAGDEELGLAVEVVVEVGQEQALASARPLTLAGSPQSVSHLPRKHSLAFDQPPAGQQLALSLKSISCSLFLLSTRDEVGFGVQREAITSQLRRETATIPVSVLLAHTNDSMYHCIDRHHNSNQSGNLRERARERQENTHK